MQFQIKKQMFVHAYRQQQRQNLIKNRRTLLLNQQKSKNPNNNMDIMNPQNIVNTFMRTLIFPYINQIIQINEHPQTISTSKMFTVILSLLPKYFQGILTFYQKSQINIQNQQHHSILMSNLIPILKVCLQNNINMVQVTNSLVELTSLPEKYLQFTGISQKMLVKQFYYLCYTKLRQSADMRIVFNSLYICGNLHYTYATYVTYVNTIKSIGQQQQQCRQVKSVCVIQLNVVNKMQQICGKYPDYQNAQNGVQLLLWFIKVSVAASNNNNNSNSKKQMHGGVQVHCRYIDIINSVIISTIAKYNHNHNGSVQQNILVTSTMLLHHIVSGTTFKRAIQEQLSTHTHTHSEYIQQNTSNSGMCTQMHRAIYVVLQQSICTLLQSSHIDNNNMVHKWMNKVCLICQQVLVSLSKHMHISMLPSYIFYLVHRVCRGDTHLQVDAAWGLINTILNTTNNNTMNNMNNMNINNSRSVCHSVMKLLLQNSVNILKNAHMYNNPKHRHNVLSVWSQLQDIIPYLDILNIVRSLIPKQQQQQQYSNNSNINMNKVQIKQCNIYLLHNITPLLLQAVHLHLQQHTQHTQHTQIQVQVQVDSEQIVTCLNVVYKLTGRWELPVQAIRGQLMALDLDADVIRMQEHQNQKIYGLALDIIQELGLDTNQW